MGEEEDTITSPTHYTWRGVECVQIQQMMTAGSFGYDAVAIGNIIKYLYRYPVKGRVEDLLKARRCIDMLVESLGGVEDADLRMEVQGVRGDCDNPGVFHDGTKPASLRGMPVCNGAQHDTRKRGISGCGVDPQVPRWEPSF